MGEAPTARDRLLELSKTMIPVLTGFLAIIVASLDKAVEMTGVASHVPTWLWWLGGAAAFLGVVALSAWCIAAAHCLRLVNWDETVAAKFGRFGLHAFVAAALVYGAFVAKVVMIATTAGVLLKCTP